MGRKILIGILSCCVFFAGLVIIYVWWILQGTSTYTYNGRTLALGDYALTPDQSELIFIGRLDSIYSTTSDGMIYGNITYTKTGKQRTFLIPSHIQQRDDLLVLFEPNTANLTNVEQQKLLFPNVSDIRKLQGHTMAFYVATTLNPPSIPPDQRDRYQMYFTFLTTQFSCNQQFIQELTRGTQQATCAPFIQTIVARRIDASFPVYKGSQ